MLPSLSLSNPISNQLDSVGLSKTQLTVAISDFFFHFLSLISRTEHEFGENLYGGSITDLSEPFNLHMPLFLV